MNFFQIINKLSLILTLFLLISCSSKNIYDKILKKEYDSPFIKKIDDSDIYKNNNNVNYDFSNKIVLKNYKNKNNYSNIVIKNSKLYLIDVDFNLLEFNYLTGVLNSSKKINNLNNNEKTLTSFIMKDDFFIISFKSGSIIKINLNGDIIWRFESDKTLNTPLRVFEDQIVSLYIDEIKSISMAGKQIWSESYEDLPIYQSKGGQIDSFLNFLFFILPNNKIGSIDLDLGIQNDNNFNKIPLITSINNTNDKLHIYENYLSYLDEGKYLYNLDIITDEFYLFRESIAPHSSSIFFNNALLIKIGSYLQAINIKNGNTFWLIEDTNISAKSKILAARNVKNNIEIYLNNGTVLTINEKKLLSITNIHNKNLKKIIFESNNLIAITETGKVIIY